MAEEKEKIDVEIDLKDKLSRPARAAAAGIDHLGEEAKETSRRLKLLQRQADKTGKSLEFAALKSRAAGMQFRSDGDKVNWLASMYSKIETNTKKVVATQKKVTAEVKKSDKGFRAFQRTLKRVSGTVVGLPKGLVGIAKGLAAVWVVAAGAAALQNVLGMVAALTSLVSLAAFIPTALGALVAVFGTLAIATKGVGDAVGAALSGDLTKLNAAMKDLSPSAQDFILDIEDMSKEFKDLKTSVQENFFKPFASLTKPFLQNVLGPIRKGMDGVATSLGYATADFMLFFRSIEGKNLIADIFDAGKDSIDGLSQATQPLLRGFAAMMAVVNPLFERLMSNVGKLGGEFGKWLEEISKSGELQTWIEQGISMLKLLWSIGTQVFEIIKGITEAVGTGGGWNALLSFLKLVNEYVNSIEGQGALKAFFESLGKILVALTPALKIVATFLGTVLAPAIADIVTNLAPGFTVFLQALADGLAQLGPFMGPLAKAVGDLLIALAPLLPVLGQLAVLLLNGLVTSLTVLAPVIKLVVEALGILLVPVINAVMEVFKAVQPYIPMFTTLFSQFAMTIIPLLQQVGTMFSQYFNVFLQKLATEILPVIMPLLFELATVFGQFLLEALTQLMPLLPDLLTLMAGMMEKSAALWPVILQLAIMFLKLAPVLIPLIPMGLKVLGIFLTMAVGITNVSTRIINAVIRFVNKIKEIHETIKQAVEGVTEALFGPFREAFDRIKNIIEEIKTTIKNTDFGALIDAGINAINPFRFAGGPVAAGQQYTVNEIGPEMFVPKTGTPSIIDGGVNPSWTAPGEGMIIPNFMLRAMENTDALMRKQVASQEKMSVPTMGGGRQEVHQHTHIHEGDELNATFTGDLHKDADIERAMSKFYKSMKRDEAERS
jgi:phage-related protein